MVIGETAGAGDLLTVKQSDSTMTRWPAVLCDTDWANVDAGSGLVFFSVSHASIEIENR